MNDFERKLSQQPFRAPPRELREAIFGRAEAPANVITPVHWTWRDWFWPSPQAWAALAALWLIFAAVSMNDRPAPDPFQASADISTPSPDFARSTLLSYHTAGSLHHVLESAN